jgi:transcriptional regulator with XRE-family HTH domain
MRGQAKVQRVKRELIAAILHCVRGLSVRQAEDVAGIQAATISRLRRGVDRDYALEVLVRAAINLGVPVDINVGRPPSRPLRGDGREGIRRPKKGRTATVRGKLTR